MTYFLDLGLDPNEKSGEYGYALHAACHTGSSTEALELLIARGADVNACGGKHETAVQCAARYGCLNAVKLLLKHGADPMLDGGKYGNAIKAALHKNHWHVANYLERHIAELNEAAKRDTKDDLR